MTDSILTLENVKEYYGNTLQDNGDLKTSACCSNGSVDKSIAKIFKLIDEEILSKFYGCGSPLPAMLDGLTILDLGCGTGRDVYTTSYLAGEKGFVIGVDMTEQQLEVARRHIDSQMQAFGFSRTNVDFRHGFIEDLTSVGIEDNSIDVVISNCVINLSPDKSRVFQEIFRVLKPGGELYFSDVFSSRRIPEAVKNDPVIYGECLGGALYTEDFRRLLGKLGCEDCRVMSKRLIEVGSEEIRSAVEMIDFYSMTIRAFKLADLEDTCEDYGQSVVYLGTVPGAPNYFLLDDHHKFITGKPELVCGNTASMLEDTRFSPHFRVAGDRSCHYGLFDCGTSQPVIGDAAKSSGGGCC